MDRSMSSYPAWQNSTELIYRLRGLSMGGAVLHIGAHPDDEDVGLKDLLGFHINGLGLNAHQLHNTRIDAKFGRDPHDLFSFEDRGNPTPHDLSFLAIGEYQNRLRSGRSREHGHP